tara:strand:- start:1865 stop:2944 length:1080 start_codon:yes stop_codon:yes gene_type:complete
MEVLRVLDFNVKSNIHDYKIKFIDNTIDKLIKEIRPGDVILIDKMIIEHFPKIPKTVPINNLLIDIEANEQNKSYEGIIPIFNKLIDNGFRKNHRIIGIGGGIIQDISAFISSIIYRGVDWIFFPTTLLAQGDSCIGSKTSINFGKYKNQVGGFYPPKKIYINIEFLETLSIGDLQSGLGEMCHYFIIAGEKDFNNYKKDYKNVFSNKSLLENIISKSLSIKKRYIEIDEFDKNKRRIFNYGHSFGHAIESLTNYKIPHGIAVSFGMDMANYISVKMGYLDSTTRIEIKEFLVNIWKDYDIKKIDITDFRNALAKDKKNVGNELRLILCKGIGEVFIAPVKNNNQLHKWLEEYFKDELE